MFGWEAPEFVHLSVILGSDRKKLSKRNGDTHVSQFLEKGYLREALLNYIALIGWNSKTTQEIFSLPELVEAFSLDGLQIANGVFDIEKLTWMNGKYIAALPVNELMNLLEDYFKQYEADFYDTIWLEYPREYNEKVVAEVQKRLPTLADFVESTTFFYHEPEVDVALLASEKMKVTETEDIRTALEFGLQTLQNLTPNPSPGRRGEGDGGVEVRLREELQEQIIPAIAEMGKKNGQILWPLRVVLTGKEFSPGVFEMVEILGIEKSKHRIERVLGRL